jgi:sugar phosphate isomerase/epimerase
MREPVIGLDSSKLPGRGTPHATLEVAAELGYRGVLFRSVLELHPNLDPAALQDVRDHADALGLFLEAGIAKVNPYMTAEFPEIRALGNGDYVAALRRMIEACAAIGIDELWTATASWKRQYPGRFQYDRFRTDAPWPDQLAAVERLLRTMRPVLLDCGAHLNVETHEEITSVEVVRLVEAVGADAVGITFDVANVVVRGEEPVAAARRCAPYVRMTHLRDVALWPSESGLWRFVVEFGRGVIDWGGIRDALAASPVRMLTVEGLEDGGGRSRKPVDLDDPLWIAGHPDLVPAEVARLLELAGQYQADAGRGFVDDYATLTAPGDQLVFLTSAVPYLTAMTGAGVLR